MGHEKVVMPSRMCNTTVQYKHLLEDQNIHNMYSIYSKVRERERESESESERERERERERL